MRVRAGGREIVGAALLALAVGCSTVKVKTDYDRNADFARYQTFQIVPGKVVANGVIDQRNTLVEDRIAAALRSELAARGLRPTLENPDLQVMFVAGARTRQELEAVGYGPGMGYYWGPTGWWGPSYGEFWTDTYTEGTLILDFIDARTGKLVWRAYLEAEDKTFTDPSFIQRAVDKALEKYPARET